MATLAPPSVNTSATWLDVSYHERDRAKAFGARWDQQEMRWYAPPFTYLQPLRRWMPSARIYLDTAFEDKEEVKGLGARWDPRERKWYITEGMELGLFSQWLS